MLILLLVFLSSVSFLHQCHLLVVGGSILGLGHELMALVDLDELLKIWFILNFGKRAGENHFTLFEDDDTIN